ncbi:jg14191, partial [Pararge aegeria aegeria]
QSSEKVLEASFELSLLIAKAKKSHSVGETLIKPCLLKAADIVLGSESKQKLSQISLSDNTVKRRIDDMAEDIKNQVVEAVKASTFFAIQLDESTDVAQCCQLIVFVRYIQNETIKDELLFSKELTTTSKASDIMTAISEFFDRHELSWTKLIGVCTDGAPAMLGSRSGFVQLVREKNPNVITIHCFIHRQALAAKTLSNELYDILKLCIKIVNYVKKSALNTRLFKALCEDLGTEHKTLLFHTEVRWLSKGNMLVRLFELRDEVIQFLEIQKQSELLVEFRKPWVQVVFAYLSDVFDSMNSLNLKLQGGDSNIIYHRDAITAYIEKLQLWKRKILACNYSCFPKLFLIIEEVRFKEVLDETDTTNKISNHLQQLTDEFQRYFPNSCDNNIYRLATDPFHVDIDALPDMFQEQALEIKNDSAAKYDFEKMDKALFWVKYLKVYPSIAEEALKLFLPFSSTYLCEKAFSTVVVIKTKYRSKLDIAITEYLRTLDKWGWGLSKEEVLDLVAAFVQKNNLKTPFKENRPGTKWFVSFRERHKLSVKKPQAVEAVRKRMTDPFVIDEYFTLLKEILTKYKINDPRKIWNLDETSVSLDPMKTKVVGAIGQPCTRTTAGTGKENITVLTKVNAAGDKINPLMYLKENMSTRNGC